MLLTNLSAWGFKLGDRGGSFTDFTPAASNVRRDSAVNSGSRPWITPVEVPTVDEREVWRKLGLSQAAFAAKFGFQPATLRNWEHGRTRPDGPARVLLAVIAQHPEAVEDSLRRAS